jgi:hypothetical protein
LSASANNLQAGQAVPANGLWTRIASALRRRLRRYPQDPRVMLLRGAVDTAGAKAPQADAPLIAVQCLEDPLYFALMSAMCEQLRKLRGVRIELVVVRSISSAVGTGVARNLARSSWLGWIVTNQWIRAFGDLAQGVAYRSQSLMHPVADTLDWLRSWVTWLRARDNPAWADLRIDGVRVGDLIIDSYLRFSPSPRFDSRSTFTRRILWQAYRDVRMARRYFRRRRPHAYLTSYATYVEHGIPVRVALLEGIRVLSFGNFTRFSKELTVQDWFHTADTSDYRAAFAALDDRPRRLAEAEQQLCLRLGGGVDPATSYMKVSAYAGAGAAVPDLSDAVVVFLHDFYDSPHVYDELVFDDFWTWACFTIDTLQAAGVRCFVKPHPNQVALSGDATRRLLDKYPDLGVLPTRVSNTQLVEAGMRCGVTVYGTVAHELAYFGVPSIACARHPHHSFDFCRTARSVEEYAAYLREAGHRPLGPAEMREQALAFYYMHNLHCDADAASLRARFIALWKACHDEDGQSAVLLREFNELRLSPAFQAFVDRLAALPRGAAQR